MMPHLCVDARLYNASGIGTYLKTVLPHLTDFQLTLLHAPGDPLGGIEVKAPIYSLAEQIELPLKIPKCDLFWAPHFNTPLLPIRAKRRMVTIFDVYHLVHYSSLSLAQKIYAKTMLNGAILHADQVMSSTHYAARELMHHATCKPKNLTLTPCAPLLTQKGVKPVKGVPSSYLLFVGNLKPHKNLDTLLKALERVDAPPLVVVGKSFGKIPQIDHYLGRVEDEELHGLYLGAEALIFPSTYEGFGIPPLEAMLCGCPVVASKIGAVEEVCGDAAEYIDPHSISSLAQGIERVLTSGARRRELIEKGKKRVQLFSAERAVEAFLEAVHACLRRS